MGWASTVFLSGLIGLKMQTNLIKILLIVSIAKSFMSTAFSKDPGPGNSPNCPDKCYNLMEEGTKTHDKDIKGDHDESVDKKEQVAQDKDIKGDHDESADKKEQVASDKDIGGDDSKASIKNQKVYSKDTSGIRFDPSIINQKTKIKINDAMI